MAGEHDPADVIGAVVAELAGDFASVSPVVNTSSKTSTLLPSTAAGFEDLQRRRELCLGDQRLAA